MNLRASDWILIAGDLLPPRVRQAIVIVVLLTLMATGLAGEFFAWLAEDIAAGLEETVLEPAFSKLLETTLTLP